MDSYANQIRNICALKCLGNAIGYALDVHLPINTKK